MLSRFKNFVRQRKRHLTLAALSGVFYFVGFCGFGQYYMAWVCLVPVLWALDDPTLSVRESLGIAWTFGLVTHLGGYYWIVGLLRDFAYLPTPVAILGLVLLCAAQGSLLAVWGVALHGIRMKDRRLFVWAAPTIMAALEWAYPALFPHFLSNSHYTIITFIQSLDVWGPVGLSAILALGSTVIYETIAWRFRGGTSFPQAAWIVFIVLVVGNIIYGVAAVTNIDDTVAEAPRRVRIGMVQTNMGIYEKARNPREGLRRHREQSLEVQQLGAELIVWPESGFNSVIYDGINNVKQHVLGPIDKPLLFGGLRAERVGEKRHLYNTAFLTDGQGNIQGTYDKIFLLAFGEYLPFGDWFPFLYDLSPHTGRFHRGQHTNPLVLDGIKYGVLICYEDVLPNFVRNAMEDEPHILVNITNDAWFGDTHEPRIHLALATFRAVEQRRFLVRSTNTGISAFVDPAGRIVKQTATFTRANLVHDVAALEGRTFYSVVGDWPGWLALIVWMWWWRQWFVSLGIAIRQRFKPKARGS